MTRDMTTGDPLHVIVRFTLPVFIGSLFQQFYSMADTIIVGRTVSVGALAAVGVTGGVCFLVLGFFFGLTGGFAVITGQCFGAGDHARMRRSVATSIILCILISAAVTLGCVATARPLFRLMNTPADIFDDTVAYMLVIYYGIWASVFYNMISSIIRALGDSVTPLIFLILASALNIGLDFLFILSFGMGVAGAAWATVLSQAVSGFLCLWYVARRFPVLRLARGDWKWDPAFAWEHLRVALPMAFQFSITAIGCIVLQAVLNLFGSTIVAGFTAGTRIDQVAVQALAAIGMTMAAYAAQNYGAGKLGRIRTGVRRSTFLSLVCSVAACVFVILFARPLTALFVGAEGEGPAVIDASRTYLILNGVFYFVIGLLFVFRSTLQGMGFAFVPLMGGVSELILRVIGAFVFAEYFGYPGVCLASPAAWFGATAILITAYFFVMRRFADMHRRRLPSGHPAYPLPETRNAAPGSRNSVPDA